LPDADGTLVAHEFDYSKTHVIYDENGVKIISFPAIHIMDGCVIFRLDWKGLSLVFSSDTYPNKWFITEAKGADLVIHECFFVVPEMIANRMTRLGSGHYLAEPVWRRVDVVGCP